jgi:hypothetical protein
MCGQMGLDGRLLWIAWKRWLNDERAVSLHRGVTIKAHPTTDSPRRPRPYRILDWG